MRFMQRFHALDLLPFVPSGADFELSLRFFLALGFRVEWQHDGLAGLRLGSAGFILQRFDDPAVQEQLMLVLVVDDLDDLWARVAELELERRFPGARVRPPTDFPWGREVHVIDPAGVCWHFRARVAASALRPLVLEGEFVRLEPLGRHHVDALAEIGLDEDLWRWTPTAARTREDMASYVDSALAEAARGAALPFATVARGPATSSSPHGALAGSTRFGAVDLDHRRVEIGWTWIAQPWQRSAVNTEAKLLLLRHAFGPLGCQRVELKTDALNQRSRAAILRLGALEEGTLRKHVVTQSGRVRDTVYYSITDEQWPAVERRLVARLGL